MKNSKIPGEQNPADLMTKYLTREVGDKHMRALGQEVREGRAQKGLEMQGMRKETDADNAVKVKVARLSRSRPATYGNGSGEPRR